MATTTAILGGGIVVNEVHSLPTGPSQDYSGNTVGNDNDEYVEFLNVSGGSIDISGWEFYSGFSGLVHTFSAGTIVPAGGFITIVNPVEAVSLTGVGGQAVFADSDLNLGTAANFFLYDPGADQYTLLSGADAAVWVGFDTANVTGAHPGATQAGATETLPGETAGESQHRVPDGDTNWISGAPTPGSANCFLTGTLIATPEGEICVEDLKPGDLILSTDGSTLPVRFLFRQTVSTRFDSAERLQPVRFTTGSLGDGLPHTDLTVTADHALLLDGVLCTAGSLVNGVTIKRVPLTEWDESFTTWHIECDDHAVAMANGTAAETYVDHTPRSLFDNHAEYLALHGGEAELTELPFPRATSVRQLPHAVLARIDTPTAA